MWDEMGLGTTAPVNEPCAQVGEENYLTKAREEAERFIELIQQKLGPEPPGARLKVKNNPHDFGTYLAVVVAFDTENEDAAAYAFLCESDGPRSWSDTEPLTKKTYEVTGYLEVSVVVEAFSAHVAEVQGKLVVRKQTEAAGLNYVDIDMAARLKR